MAHPQHSSSHRQAHINPGRKLALAWGSTRIDYTLHCVAAGVGRAAQPAAVEDVIGVGGHAGEGGAVQMWLMRAM